MENEALAKKLANLIGTSTIVAIGSVGFFASGTNVLPHYSYINACTFANPHEFKVSLLNEEDLVYSNDNAIPIPEVQKMVFKFSQPVVSSFSV